MASPERVQEYLKHHKVGVLFEDLMAKVIADMPDDPVVYLARILTLKAERKGSRSLKTTTYTDNLAVAKKSSEKPWVTNSKRLKPRDIDTKTAKKTSKPEWNYRTKVVTSSFDDLWDEPKSMRKSQPGSPTKGNGVMAWNDPSIDEGEDVMFSVYGYRGPHRSNRESADPLAEELRLVKDKTESNERPATRAMSKKSGPRFDSAQHKMALQQYIKEHEQKHDSGIDEERDLESDDAIELLENLDDLRREGVRNVKQSGVKVSRSYRQQSSMEPLIRVSICARCAKVMGGGVPSDAVPGAAFTDVTDYNYDTVRDTTSTQAQSTHFPASVSDDDDEEFESVSQVTGPRRPVWQESDNEGRTPSKNKLIMASNMSPSKSVPVYSSDRPQESSKGHKKGSAVLAKSSQFYEHSGQDLTRDPLHMTWSPAAALSSTDSEHKQDLAKSLTMEMNRTAKDDDVANTTARSHTARSHTARSGSAAWQVPPDYDTDSSFYGSPGASKPLKFDRAY